MGFLFSKPCPSPCDSPVASRRPTVPDPRYAFVLGMHYSCAVLELRRLDVIGIRTVALKPGDRIQPTPGCIILGYDHVSGKVIEYY